MPDAHDNDPPVTPPPDECEIVYPVETCERCKKVQAKWYCHGCSAMLCDACKAVHPRD